MAFGSRPYLAAAVVVLVSVSSTFAQNPRTVRWTQGDPSSDQFTNGGVVIKRVRVDGITVRASIVDGISVEVTISNQGQTPVDVRPDQITLEVTKPGARALARIPPEQAADSAVALANSQASMVEFSGSMATKTVTETHTTWSDSASAPLSQRTGSGETPHVVTTTTTKTVPDDHARFSAKSRATHIRNGAQFDRQRILDAALAPSTLQPTYSVSGVVYFDREKDPKEVLLRVPVGNVIVEIPFTASKKRVLLWLKLNEFK